jgi:hypothetical protein
MRRECGGGRRRLSPQLDEDELGLAPYVEHPHSTGFEFTLHQREPLLERVVMRAGPLGPSDRRRVLVASDDLGQLRR